MPLPPNNVDEGIMFLDCHDVHFVCSSILPFVCSSVHLDSGQTFLPQYLMNVSSSLNETYREYSLAPIFWPG